MNIFINSQYNYYNNNWNFIQVYNLGELANVRKTNLKDNADYLCFMWKADVVESWIADKEAHVRSDEFGRDLSSVQTLLTKQETFDIGLKAFETEGIQNITELKDKLISSNHIQVRLEILMLISGVFNITYLFIYFLYFYFFFITKSEGGCNNYILCPGAVDQQEVQHGDRALEQPAGGQRQQGK